MVKPFRFIASMPKLTEPVTWRAELRRIEALGFDTVAVSDHFTQGWVMEPLAAMAAALEATTTLRVMGLALCNDYRHPVLLHKALATLDVLSGGRVEAGLGAGWMRSDYDAAGIPLDPAATRVERLGEAVEVLKGLFGPAPLTFSGRHYQVEALDGLPKPAQAPRPPLLVGGGGPKVLALAGRAADAVGINPGMGAGVARDTAVLDLTPERVAEKVAWARAAARAAGRDPDALDWQISVLSLRVTGVAGATGWASSLAAGVGDLDALAGSPAVLHGDLDRCADLLVERRERFGFNYVHLGNDLTAAAPLVARLAGA